MSLAPSPDGTEKGGGASLCWVSRFLWGNPGGTRGQSLPPDRDRQQGQQGRARVPGGIAEPAAPLPPQPPARPDPEPTPQVPVSPSRGAPRSPTTGYGCMSARSQSPKPPNGGQGWRITKRRSTKRGRGPGAPHGGMKQRRGHKGSGRAHEGCERVRGGARWVWGRRAHLPLVSAAIAGHMTEAVAGMSAWALATRGGRPLEGGGSV